jgi:hypothetical protein
VRDPGCNSAGLLGIEADVAFVGALAVRRNAYRLSTRATRSATASGWFEVVIEQIEIDGILRLCIVAPQFACRETYRIDVLRLQRFFTDNSRNWPKIKPSATVVTGVSDVRIRSSGSRTPRSGALQPVGGWLIASKSSGISS